MPFDQATPPHLPPAPPPVAPATAPILTTLVTPGVTAGSLASRTFGIWWKNLWRFSVMMLLVYLPVGLMGMGAAILIPNVRSGAQSESLLPILAGGIAAAVLVAIPLMVIMMGGLSYGVIEHLAGRRPRIGAMLKQGFRKVWPLTVCMLLVGLAVMGGYILLIVPGIMIAIATSLAIPALTVEAIGPVDAFKRSLDLTRGYRWSILGGFALVVIAQFAANMVGNLLGLVHPIVGAVVTVVVVIPMAALSMVTPAVAYHDLRLAKEGVDTSALARVFD